MIHFLAGFLVRSRGRPKRISFFPLPSQSAVVRDFVGGGGGGAGRGGGGLGGDGGGGGDAMTAPSRCAAAVGHAREPPAHLRNGNRNTTKAV